MAGFSTITGGQVGGLPKISYDNLVISGKQYGFPVGLTKKILYYPAVEIIDNKDDVGVLTDPVIVYEVVRKIWYVKDVRHSHILDSHDTTLYSVTGTTVGYPLIIDYGTVINAKYIFIIFGLWVSAGQGTIYIDISQDNSTYTNVYTATSASTSEAIYAVLIPVTPFRYLRIGLVNSTTGATQARIRKVIILYE